MQGIDNPTEFRLNIKKHLLKLIDDPKIWNNIEKGVFNFAIKEATKKKLIKKWDNPYFVIIYKDKLRTVYINLLKKILLVKIKIKKSKHTKLPL